MAMVLPSPHEYDEEALYARLTAGGLTHGEALAWMKAWDIRLAMSEPGLAPARRPLLERVRDAAAIGMPTTGPGM